MPVRKSLSDLNCSLAKALDIMGDGWSMLVLRDLFIGARRFQDIVESTGVARNTLTERLNRLVENGLVDKSGSDHRPFYALSDKGYDLVPALIALMQWGDRWLVDGKPPMVIEDHKGREIPAITLTTAKGKAVDLRKLQVKAGPGAAPQTKAWLEGLGSIPSR
ncbi:MAG: helix-turn-helix domain-containing protein [Deltaproteobacteria bacterium]